ncbi:MAG: PEP-CTERM sorting domain-containing protein [Pirellulaceae bacterium]|nr:PEP-CTERM sorting domain-containing protein [Pirellulaceae bacterium]MDG2102925.1 PEP-CTERM sorting domain-containing protein [Pirellulaceae bacterium]
MIFQKCAAARQRTQDFKLRPLRFIVWVGCVVALGFVGHAQADVIDDFDNVAGTPTGEFGWDDFNGASYGGPHTPDQFVTGTGNANITVTPIPTPPGGVVAGNLYAHTTVPNWKLNLTGLSSTNAFTSIAVQVATTADFTGANLDASNFLMDGMAPDEFIDLGSRTSIPGNGGVPSPVNFYWAEWIGESAETDYTVDVSGAGGFFQVLAGAKVSYFNTESSFNITSSVPEPSSIIVLGCVALVTQLRRKRSR